MRPAGQQRHVAIPCEVAPDPRQRRGRLDGRDRGLLGQPAHGDEDRRCQQQQRQQHAPAAVGEQSRHAAACHQQGGKVAGDGKEQRHAEQVQEPGERIDDDRAGAVCGGPDRLHQRAVGECGMEHHAGQHGQRAQVVHAMDASIVLHGRRHQRKDGLRAWTHPAMRMAMRITASSPARMPRAAGLQTIWSVCRWRAMLSSRPMP